MIKELSLAPHCSHYSDVSRAKLDYIKANYPSAEVMFKSGNFGFLLVLSNIRKFGPVLRLHNCVRKLRKMAW